MANRLQFKRGSGVPTNIFYEGEPIYDKSSKVLYIGDNGGSGAGAGSSIGSNATYLASLEMLYKSSSAGSGSIRFYEDTDFGTDYVAVAAASSLASSYTLTLPTSAGSPDQVLKTDGTGALSWTTMAINSFTTIAVGGTAATSGSSDIVSDSAGDVLTFAEGEGIDIFTDASTDTITIAAEIASSTNAGVASFKSGDFTVTAGGQVALGSSISFTNATFSNINVTGVSTLGIATATQLSVSGLSTFSGITTHTAELYGTQASFSGIVTTGTLNSTTGTITNLSGTTLNYSGVGTITTLNSTTGTITNLSGTTLNYSGVGTITTLNSTTGTVTNISGTSLNYSGVGTITTLNSTTGTITNLSGTSLNYSGVGTFGTVDVNSLTQDRIVYVGSGSTLVDSSNLTFNGTTLTVGSGVGITQFSSSVTSGIGSTTQVPTSSAVVNYVGNQIAAIDLTVTTAEGTNGTGGGGGSFNTSQTLTFAGTTNEVDVTVSGQTVTYGLPQDVTIGRDLTVNGNLRVVGTAVTFETEIVKVEDRIIELGMIDGLAPSSATSWDTGILFNYHNGTNANKSGVIWLDNTYVAIASSTTESNVGVTTDIPQVTITQYAPIIAKDLYFGGTDIADNLVLRRNESLTGIKNEAVNLVFDGGTY